MSKEKEPSFEIIELEDELDERLLEQFADGIEKEINHVLSKNTNKDGRKELVNVLLSLVAGLSLDMEVSYEEFLDLASLFYEESKKAEDEIFEGSDKYRLN